MKKFVTSKARVVILLALLNFAGCGKKPATPPPESSTASASPEAMAPAAPAVTPAPVPPVPGEVAPASQEAPAPLAPELLDPKGVEKNDRAYEVRLQKYSKWLKGIKTGNEAEKQRILAEIRAARLSEPELAELDGIKTYFGVTVSFR